MPRPLSTAALLLVLAAPLAAQASAYIPLDDPRLPLLEHLIARGEVEDPSPMVRPFRRADAIRVLKAAIAGGALRDGALADRLREGWSEGTAEARWEVEGRAGGQAYTDARRDPLHPAGPEGIRPFAELRLQATFDRLVLVSRPAIETRLVRDPDWPGRRNLDVAGRHIEGYLSAQFRYARLFYGQMDQNWGPVGFTGIGLSDYGYPRPAFGIEIGTDRFKLTAQATTLADQTDTLGRTIHRYFFAHRVAARVSDRLHLALWETVVLAGPDRSFDARYRNPVTLLLLANQYGLGDQGNVLLGADLHWRAGKRVTLFGQLALDDLQYQDRSGPTRAPDRFALTLAGTGPLTGDVGWRAGYTLASSLAFRTSDPFENFTEQGVGLGSAFGDNDQLTLSLSAPVAGRWLLAPELTLLRQGEGRLSDPFPAGTARGDTPVLFIGTTRRTWRAAVGLTGRQGILSLSANAGVHYVQNAGHVDGRNRTDFVGRIQATLGFGTRGDF